MNSEKRKIELPFGVIEYAIFPGFGCVFTGREMGNDTTVTMIVGRVIAAIREKEPFAGRPAFFELTTWLCWPGLKPGEFEFQEVYWEQGEPGWETKKCPPDVIGVFRENICGKDLQAKPEQLMPVKKKRRGARGDGGEHWQRWRINFQ